jgi:hypothetical protein
MTAKGVSFEPSEPGWDEDNFGGFGGGISDDGQEINERQELDPTAETFGGSGGPERVVEEPQSISRRMSIDSRVRFLRRDSADAQNGMSETKDRVQDQQTVQHLTGRQRNVESSSYLGSRKHPRSPSPKFPRVRFDEVKEIQRSQVPIKEPPSFKIR